MQVVLLCALCWCLTFSNHEDVNKDVDIVVVTHDAFVYAKQGLETVKQNTDWQRARLHIVDSGSHAEAVSWFEEFCESCYENLSSCRKGRIDGHIWRSCACC